MEPERFETVVVGGGQAGLATGYHLARRGRPFVILDAGERVGDAWRGALGLAAAVHPGPLQRAAGHGLPRRGLALPHQGRDGRLPGDLRGPVPAPGPHRRAGRRAHPAGRPVPGHRRGAPVRGRQRGGGLGRLPPPEGPRLRRRARPGHPPAPLQRLPAPVPAPRGRRAGGRRGQLRGRDRPRAVGRPPDLAVGPAPGQRADPRREPAGPAAHPAVLVLHLPGADGGHAGSAAGSGPSCMRGRHAPGPGQARGPRRRRGRAGAADGRGPRRPAPCWRTAGSSRWPTWSGAPASGPTSPGSTCPVFDDDGEPRHDRGVVARPARPLLRRAASS